MSKLCGECGKREMIYKNINGRSDFSWKDYPNIKIVVDLDLLVCSNCGNIGLISGDSEKLDNAIECSIKQQCNNLITFITTKNKCEQKELANHIGISPEHLSQIKTGRMIPSFTTFNFLKTIAMSDKGFKISSPQLEIKLDYKVAMKTTY